MVSPNPSDASVTVVFSASGHGEASLSVYDMAGREVRMISLGEPAEGINTVAWDGRSNTGETLSPGVYLVRIRQNGSGSKAERVVLLP